MTKYPACYGCARKGKMRFLTTKDEQRKSELIAALPDGMAYSFPQMYCADCLAAKQPKEIIVAVVE